MVFVWCKLNIYYEKLLNFSAIISFIWPIGHVEVINSFLISQKSQDVKLPVKDFYIFCTMCIILMNRLVYKLSQLKLKNIGPKQQSAKSSSTKVNDKQTPCDQICHWKTDTLLPNLHDNSNRCAILMRPR